VLCSELATENALLGAKLGKNKGESGRILTRNDPDLPFLVPKLRCKISSKLIENCRRRRRNSLTDKSDFVTNLSREML